MGLNEKKWNKIKEWTCNSCSQPETEEVGSFSDLFCSYLTVLNVFQTALFHPRLTTIFKELYCVCQTPYDNTRFYVGCDRCEGWYHPQCVGITQALVLQKLHFCLSVLLF